MIPFSAALCDRLTAADPTQAAAARSIAANAFADTIGCIWAGSGQEAVVHLRNALSVPTHLTPVVRPGPLCRPDLAALINGTAAHALEFDDHENVGVTHPSAVLVPALLALVEQTECSGEALLDAYVAGYETIGAIGTFVNPSHYAKGWHATSTLGTIGAAVACAVLQGNEPSRVAEAAAISCSMAGGTRAQFGTMTKPIHAGFAAQAGVTSALLAAGGITASPDALDGPFGLFALMSDAGERSFTPPDRWDFPSIIDNSPIVKLYPSCAATHRSLDAVMDLMAAHDLSPGDVARVSTDIPAIAASALVDAYPRDVNEARFSMHYCLACVVEQGRLGLSDFADAALQRPAMQTRASHISLTFYEIKGDPFADGNYRVRTALKTRNGVTFEDERFYAKGSRRFPVSKEALRAKFIHCVGFAGEPTNAGADFDALIGIAGSARASEVLDERLYAHSNS